jgi:hypothetical protein
MVSVSTDVTAQIEEKLILAALSDLSIWAGRYSAASRMEDYFGKENAHAMLDYGSRIVTMPAFSIVFTPKHSFQICRQNMPRRN